MKIRLSDITDLVKTSAMLVLDTGELSIQVKKSKTYDFSLFEEISRDEVYQMILTLKEAAEEFKE